MFIVDPFMHKNYSHITRFFQLTFGNNIKFITIEVTIITILYSDNTISDCDYNRYKVM